MTILEAMEIRIECQDILAAATLSLRGIKETDKNIEAALNGIALMLEHVESKLEEIHD